MSICLNKILLDNNFMKERAYELKPEFNDKYAEDVLFALVSEIETARTVRKERVEILVRYFEV